MNVVAYNTTDGTGKCWRVEGGIKRITDDTVSLIGTVTYTVTATDGGNMATADIVATADNTNKALAITVTGVAAKTIDWIVRLDSVEYRA
jgi:hypothetical protein